MVKVLRFAKLVTVLVVLVTDFDKTQQLPDEKDVLERLHRLQKLDILADIWQFETSQDATVQPCTLED